MISTFFEYGSLSLNNTVQWTKSFGGKQNDVLQGLAVDSDDNIIIGTYFSGNSSYGGATVTSAGSSDIAITKLNSTGGNIWTIRQGSVNLEALKSLAVDSNNNIVIAVEADCSVGSNINLGGPNMACKGVADWVIAKYDSSGQFVWSFLLGGTATDVPHFITTDYQDNIFVTGSVQNISLAPNETITGSKHLLVKYNSSGYLLWYNTSNSYGAAGVDSAGNIFVPENTGVKLVKYSATGDRLWQYNFPSSTFGKIAQVANDGTIYVIGQYISNSVFNTTITGPTTIYSKGVFLASFAQDGSVNWVVGYACIDSGSPQSVAALNSVRGAAIGASYKNSFLDLNNQNVTALSTVGEFVSTVIAPSPSPSVTPSSTPSTTPSVSPTPSSTPSSSITPSITPSVTPSSSVSVTPSISPTRSVTPSITSTPSITPTRTPSVTPSTTPSNTPTPSPSSSVSVTPSISVSPSVSVTPSTPSALVSPSVSVTPSTPSASTSPSSSPSDSNSSPNVLVIALPIALGLALLGTVGAASFYAIKKRRSRAVALDQPDDL